MFKLFNIFKKKQVVQALPKLTLEPTSPFYKWNVIELKPYWEIEWFDLLELGVIKQIEGDTAYIYYISSPNTWKNLHGREANIMVCLKRKEIIEYDLISMN